MSICQTLRRSKKKGDDRSSRKAGDPTNFIHVLYALTRKLLYLVGSVTLLRIHELYGVQIHVQVIGRYTSRLFTRRVRVKVVRKTVKLFSFQSYSCVKV